MLDGGQRTEGGEWWMEDRGQRCWMVDGGWWMVHGGLRMEDGGWRMQDGGWRICSMGQSLQDIYDMKYEV